MALEHPIPSALAGWIESVLYRQPSDDRIGFHSTFDFFRSKNGEGEENASRWDVIRWSAYDLIHLGQVSIF